VTLEELSFRLSCSGVLRWRKSGLVGHLRDGASVVRANVLTVVEDKWFTRAAARGRAASARY
jgi:hypothetical protein